MDRKDAPFMVLILVTALLARAPFGVRAYVDVGNIAYLRFLEEHLWKSEV